MENEINEHPGKKLDTIIMERGWSQSELAEIMGKSKQLISKIILGELNVSTGTAYLLAEALGTTPEYWIQLQTAYDVSCGRQMSSTSDVVRKARLYSKFPVREMMKRGWIARTDSIDELERAISTFFEKPQFPFAARRKSEDIKEPLQQAWLYRSYNIAKTLQVAPYSEIKLARSFSSLKSLLGEPTEAVQVPRILSESGVRFLVVEALPASMIDGVCFWLDSNSPVVALSIRYDRIDNFWFTLMHELQHVRHRHGQEHAMLDVDIMENDTTLSEEERMADEGASEFLIPHEEIENFIARVGPLFSEIRIKGFAKRIGVHPGIVVGQLQRRKALDYSHHRKELVKIRKSITSTSTHDGWGMVA